MTAGRSGPQRRRPITVALLAVLLGVLCTACGGREAVPPPAPALPPAAEVSGRVVDVRSWGGDVSGFTVSSQGNLVEVSIADDVSYGFDLNHLREHMATGDPVRCIVEHRGGRVYAVSILDA